MKVQARKHFLKFFGGFILLISFGLIGALGAGLYVVNQEETALVYEIFK